ncbi:hypothetical protein [Laspinema palackyanum]|uniref:hypothetical protein n=1 Tax=Laspinema palackyanum TaxID=3231601 RepID=UPI00345CEEFD|nr:hypothetical protein [Laspinema sp. D2c]
MKNYFQNQEYVLKWISFYYLGFRYQGRGVMTWNPEQGFYIQAFLETPQEFPKTTIELNKPDIIRKQHLTSIRMKSTNFTWAIVPNVHLGDQGEMILLENRIFIKVSRVIFYNCWGFSNKPNNNLWGSALYKTASKLRLPDKVSTEVLINDQQREFKEELSGILYEDENNYKLVGRMIDDRYLKISWLLPTSQCSKVDNWKWSEALQDSFSLLYGESIELVRREIRRGYNKIYSEIKHQSRLDSLGVLSPLKQTQQLNKSSLMLLTQFFVTEGVNSGICRQMFKQMLEASRQESWQARELLLSTILEAALRTIENHPFKPRDHSFQVAKALKNFREKYFSKDWKPEIKKILDIYENMRHRNAHPDFLLKKGGYLSEEYREKSVDDMIYLSRFYGYMILAMAGFQDLEPQFPPPFAEWKATVKIEPPQK